MVIDYLLSIILGVLSSLVASIVFLLAISRLRPRVKISESIAKGRSAVNADIYLIKVVNRGPRPIINIKARLQLIRPINVPNGAIEQFVDIPLIGSDPLELVAFSKEDDMESYAYRFSTDDDLDTHWADDQYTYLRFTIFATDALSGFGKVFTQKYRLKRIVLKEGDFVKGQELMIV
jgi:hypothetical protein